MTDSMPKPWRRLGLVALSLACAALLLRAPLASAFVGRGDELLYQGNGGRAVTFYARALIVDPDDAIAVDRYAFAEIMRHRAANLRLAVAATSSFLTAHPGDATVRMDRALAELGLARDAAAEDDFEIVGRTRRDARAFVFAGYAALKVGAVRRARRWWRAALALHPAYVPARRALRLTP